MKVSRIRSKEQATRSIAFLKENGSCNLYLYEGLALNSPHHHNLFFYDRGEICGLLHTKSGISVHILLAGSVPGDAVSGILKAVLRRFGGLRSYFGDYGSILRLASEKRAGQVSLRKYYFMVTEEDSFTPRVLFGGVVPGSDDASLILPLQRQYEIEEMEVDPTLLDPERIEAALSRRIACGDITAVYEEGKPVAIAGINARYSGICQIGSVYVLPAYRRKKYGYSVVSSHVSRLLERYNKVALFVDVNNRKACHLYEMLGFKKKGMLAQLEESARF
jgi:ribosomal protein S18 acetylase RimI-like enzyme